MWPELRVQYLLLRWTRNETSQLSMKRILDIASWIEPNWWVIGSAHYLSFVINVCCCNKRLGPSVVCGTNGFEFLYNGRQNTQGHRVHNEPLVSQTNSITIVNKGVLTCHEINGKVKGGVRDASFCHFPWNSLVLYSPTKSYPAKESSLFKISRYNSNIVSLVCPLLTSSMLLRNCNDSLEYWKFLSRSEIFGLEKIIILNIFSRRTYICFLFC